MHKDTQQALLTLMRLPFLGPATYQQLTHAFGSPIDILAQAELLIAPYLDARALTALRHYRDSSHNDLAQRVAEDLQWLDENPEVQLVSFQCNDYPQLLAKISRPPPVLFVRGNQALLEMPQLAIVGSRNPTAGGVDNAQQFAAYLAAGGFCITSGLALGVDTAAHQGAIAAGGATIAVLGTGIDLVYPARNKLLAKEIVEKGGALVSEFMLNTPSQACNFPRRNRIISGLSLGTLVVEAAIKSGSLITARVAVEQEREVFAIPGSIHNPLAKGGHYLIKNGATLVETGSDIVDELGGLLAFKQAQVSGRGKVERDVELSLEEQKVLQCLGYDPVDIDTLCERCQIGTGVLGGLLVGLEIKGKVNQEGALYLKR